MTSEPITEAAERGIAAANRLADEVDANELERRSILEIESRVRHGYKFIDLIIRKDGVETRHQADWLVRLLRRSAR